MAKRPRPAAGARTRRRADNRGTNRFERAGNAVSDIVREAASLLDAELAAGIVTAKRMQERFAKERRLDPADLKESLTRLQTDAHDIVAALDTQLTRMRSDENTELASRLTRHAHDLVDVLVNVVNMGAELAVEIADKNLRRKPARKVVRRAARATARPKARARRG